MVQLAAALAAAAVGAGGVSEGRQAPAAGQDLRLTYRSPVDGSEQPYRLYVPSRYDRGTSMPLVIFLHGTSGNESTVFDDPRYGSGVIKSVAEKYGTLLVSPLGWGAYEYRDIGENDVFCVLEEVRKRYRVDDDRIYVTGHSMGGSGSAYLALHYPDVFAAAAPLAAAISYPWLAANARYVPFWWISGTEDRPKYRAAVAVGFGRMVRLGSPSRADFVAGEAHFGPVKDLDRIFAWLVGHRRTAHPREYVFEVDTPMHGRAYWTSVERLEQPGRKAVIRARAEERGRARLDPENVAELVFVPDPEVFDLSRPVELLVAGRSIFSAVLERGQQVRLTAGPAGWSASTEPYKVRPRAAWRANRIARAPETLAMEGTEARLANWITDAMRDATRADVALYRRTRSTPIPAGPVDIGDLIECSRPWDMLLITVSLTGRDLLEVLDANVAPEGDDGIIQLSGARYAFDRRRPAGRRILWSDLEPHRSYTVALEGQSMEEESIQLAGRFGRMEYRTSEVSFLMALYGYAMKKGSVEARIEGRVVELPSRSEK
jgi:poly(3-hydroxybutyrate) depolymerase